MESSAGSQIHSLSLLPEEHREPEGLVVITPGLAEQQGTSPSFLNQQENRICSLGTSLLKSELTLSCQTECKCWKQKSRNSLLLRVHALKFHAIQYWGSFGDGVSFYINISYGYKTDGLGVMEWYFRKHLCDLRHRNWHQMQSANMLGPPFETEKGIIRHYSQLRH